MGGGLGRYVPKNLQDEDTATAPQPRDVSKARLPVSVGGGLVNLRLWMWLS